MRLIDGDALIEDFKSRLPECNDWIENAKDNETKIRADTIKTFIAEVILTIDNAPTLSVHEIITNVRYLQDFKRYGVDPIPNNYVMHIDTNSLILRCPKCGCGIIATAFSYAVGSNGYAFCPYCGEDMRR